MNPQFQTKKIYHIRHIDNPEIPSIISLKHKMGQGKFCWRSLSELLYTYIKASSMIEVQLAIIKIVLLVQECHTATVTQT